VTYAYSYDADAWYSSDAATREEALQAAKNELDEDDPRTVWTGLMVPATTYLQKLSIGFIVQDMIENLDESLGETMGADRPILQYGEKHATELVALIRNWITANIPMTYFGVVDIQEHDGDRPATAVSGAEPGGSI